MSNRRGPPKHQNAFAWKPNAGVKINETEVGGRFRPYSEITGVCVRCKEQIEWKRRYRKYKGLTEPAKCQKCTRRGSNLSVSKDCVVLLAFMEAFMLILGCAKEQKVCAKCRCQVDNLVGRDSSEVEAEQKALEEAIKNARERDRRTLLRAMNKSKDNNSGKDDDLGKSATEKANKVGDIFPSSSLEDYARSRQQGRVGRGNEEEEVEGEEEVEDNTEEDNTDDEE
ncbi:hypothetical protein EUGRSUZ_L02288 [Eucalyptus grandis]|uniref:Uncharacterized protein n=1 Tax=Eucalyptus grandis TaxID=71139 RepID=A0A058ZR55_EUCGR|nr:hypothetical protein EUGRSUZ_L02288 [Eucalyptus grandis]